MDDPTAGFAYRQLAAAILKRAVIDSQSQNGAATEARAWLACDPLAGLGKQKHGRRRGRVDTLPGNGIMYRE